jgi:hypothetical protein
MKAAVREILILLVFLMLAGCSKNVEYSDLRFKGGLAYYRESEKPFTGKASTYFDSDKKRSNFRLSIRMA